MSDCRSSAISPPGGGKITLCFLVQHLSIGGIETRLLKLLRTIDRTRFDPRIICARDDGLQGEAFKALGVPILTTPGLLPVNRLIQAAEVPRILWAARTFRFDVIVSFLASSQPFEVYLARFGCRRGGFMYALMNRDWQGATFYWNKRKTLAARIVAVSRKTAEFFYPPGDPAWDKLNIISNGVDLARFTPQGEAGYAARASFGLPGSAVVFTYPARVAQQKQHEVMLAVAEIVAAQNPQVHFAVAGQDKRDGWLQAEIARRGLNGSVSYLGPVHEMARLLAASDAVLMTSAWEGCPNALLEGLATGLPAVVTQSGAEEFVVEGETGFSVPVGDTCGLAERVLLLAEDDGLRQEMGGNARLWMERYGSIERMLDSWFAEFSTLAGIGHEPVKGR